jgi:hypothetical protein
VAKDRSPAQKINEKGYPLLRKPSVPGYNKPSGTPGYVSKAASSAAKKAK